MKRRILFAPPWGRQRCSYEIVRTTDQPKRRGDEMDAFWRGAFCQRWPGRRWA